MRITLQVGRAPPLSGVMMFTAELTETETTETTEASCAYDLLVSIRIENMRGRLFTDWALSASDREYLQDLVDVGVVLVVPATAASLVGYVAVPRSAEHDLDALERAMPACTAPGGEC